jgi:exopolyphosphatase/guanosine-5'-triphosphate,3'-diphosphate pyrophosphatase
VVAEGWSKKDISLPALQRLRAALLQESKTVNIVERWNLHPARAQVLTGGFTVLYGLCEALGVEHLQVSDCAQREGLLYDLMGRIRHEDVRHRTIAALSHRYGIDSEQAERVTATCQNLLTQARTVWGLEGEEYGYALEWAARLHEIGLAIAHNQHHKHGAYVIAHADLPGFSRSEQGLLAALIRGQRRKFSPKIFTNLPKDTIVPAQCLGVLLRLAIVLHRSRSRQLLPDIALQIAGQQVALRFPPNWLNAHPLTRADLEVEAEHLQKAGFKLVIGQA